MKLSERGHLKQRYYAVFLTALICLQLSVAPGGWAEAAAKGNPAPETPPVRLSTTLDRALSDVEILLALSVLGFGLLALVLQSVMFWRQFATADFVKLTSATVVVTATLFLITAGFSNNQIAPAMGLFGTMVGYLLGREVAGRRGSETVQTAESTERKE